MKTLFLVRHAKSSRNEPALQDKGREVANECVQSSHEWPGQADIRFGLSIVRLLLKRDPCTTSRTQTWLTVHRFLPTTMFGRQSSDDYHAAAMRMRPANRRVGCRGCRVRLQR